MELNEQVGLRLRELRERRGLSLSALARRAGTGKATLSGLESGRRNPTLETLYALTTALDVPLSSVLTEPAQGLVLRPGVPGQAVTAALLERVESATGVVEVYRVRIRSGVVQESAAHLPGTRERLVVLDGRARVGPLGRARTVGAGEEYAWRADGSHEYSALDGKDVEAVLFIDCPYGDGAGAAGAAAGAL